MKNIKNSQVKDLKEDIVKSPRKLNKVKVALLSTLFIICVLGGYKTIQLTYNYFHSHTYINLKVNFSIELPKMITNEEYQKQLDQEKQVDEMSKRAVELLKKDSSFNLVKPVQAIDRYCDSPIDYIRCSGEDLGKSNSEISTMIKIAKAESNLNPKSKNKTSSASGLFQITSGTWFSNDCIGDKYDYKDNTVCAWKIQTKRGYTPWEVYNKGLIK